MDTMTRTSAPWRPILSDELASTARHAAFEILEKYRDRGFILECVAQCQSQTTLPFTPEWRGVSLPFGDAGAALALGHAHRIEPTRGWDRLAHQYVTAAVSKIDTSESLGMIGGLTGLAFAVHYLAQGNRYVTAAHALDEALLDRLPAVLHALPQNPDQGVTSVQFDLVSGIAGIIRYLLLLPPTEKVTSVLHPALAWLATRATPSLKGFVTPEHLVPERERHDSPLLAHGYLNCGLAHGVPGPLVALTAAADAGHTLDGKIPTSIANISNWLLTQRYEDEWGDQWPTHHTLEGAPPPWTRAAWCYGVTGVARSLQLAGQSLARRDLQNIANKALLSIQQRPIQHRNIDSPTFCHGIAGLLQTVLRAAVDTGDQAFDQFAATLTQQLLDAYDPSTPLGFQDLEPRDTRVDSPGLLTGALSPALVLLAASTTVAPSWDYVFGISRPRQELAHRHK